MVTTNRYLTKKNKINENVTTECGIFLCVCFTSSFIFTDTKKDDTFGQDDKDWDVYKEIVSLDFHNIFTTSYPPPPFITLGFSSPFKSHLKIIYILSLPSVPLFVTLGGSDLPGFFLSHTLH